MSNTGVVTTTTATRSDAYTNICPDGHACDNDASCVESLLQENKFVCDCHDAYLQTGRVYAGLSCQHVATEYCTTSGEISENSFCVNQGVCNSEVSPTAAHPGCKCPKNYAGEHCQFIAGSQPEELSYFLDGTTYAAAHRTPEGSGVNPAAIVVPILLVTLGAVGFFLWKYRGLSLTNHNHTVDKTKKADENMMEADGSASMSTSMAQMVMAGRRMSTPAFSSTHKSSLMDPPDFEDLLEQSDHVNFHMDPTGTATHKLFASDPTLHYNPTTLTAGSSGSEEYDMNPNDMNPNNVFEEYDPNDFTTEDHKDDDRTFT